MPATLLADVIVPSVFTPYVVEQTAKLSALIRMGIIASSPDLAAAVNGPGNLVQMPFWKDLTGNSSIVTSGGTVAVNNITTSKDQAGRLLRQRAWGAEDIAGMFAGSDPMGAIGDLVAGFWARDFQDTVISLLKGVFASASMSGSVLPIAKTSGAILAANTLNGVSLINAASLLGDSKGKLTGIAMHSAVEGSLAKLDLIDTALTSEGKIAFRRFMGFDVIVDDSCPVDTIDGAPAYTTYLFGQGAIGYAENTTPQPIPGGIGDWTQELFRNAAGGISNMITRRNFILHPRGVKWNGTTLAAESPTNAELEVATNWSRVYEQKNVRLVKIQHNVLA